MQVGLTIAPLELEEDTMPLLEGRVMPLEEEEDEGVTPLLEEDDITPLEELDEEEVGPGNASPLELDEVMPDELEEVIPPELDEEAITPLDEEAVTPLDEKAVTPLDEEAITPLEEEDVKPLELETQVPPVIIEVLLTHLASVPFKHVGLKPDDGQLNTRPEQQSG